MPTITPTPTCRVSRRQTAAQTIRSCIQIPARPHALASYALLIDRILPHCERQGEERRRRPSGNLIRVTEIACVRNLQRLSLLRPNEPKCMAADLHVAKSLRDWRHMTGGASAARAAESVMRVLLDAGGMGTVLRVGAVAGQAHRIPQLAQHRLVFRAVRIVATETRDAARVHEALNEIVALHAVLVRRTLGKVREACFTELVLFKLPKICKVQSNVEADGPIVVLPLDRVIQRTALRMTLDANVVGMHIVEARGIEDVVARRVG